MEMKIRGGGRHYAARARIGSRRHIALRMVMTRRCYPSRCVSMAQIISQFQNDQVPRLHPKVGRLDAVAINVAVANRAIFLFFVVFGQVHGEHAILASQVFGLGNNATDGWTWTHFSERFLSLQIAVGRNTEKNQTDCHEKLLHLVKDSIVACRLREGREAGRAFRIALRFTSQYD